MRPLLDPLDYLADHLAHGRWTLWHDELDAVSTRQTLNERLKKVANKWKARLGQMGGLPYESS